MKYFNLNQLTYALLASYSNALLGVFGIIAITLGHVDLAFILLILAALLDAFDGVIARLHVQTVTQQTLGTVADSVADMVSFGVLPIVIFLSITPLNWVTGIVATLYVFAAIHRLSVFTVNALQTHTATRRFTGLPVVMGAATLAISYALWGSYEWFGSFMTGLVLILAILFVSKLSIPKPRGLVSYAGYVLIAGLTIVGVVLW